MAALKHTPSRHRLLAEVATGRMKVYIGLHWNLLRGDSFVRGAEVRVAEAIRPFVCTVLDRLNVNQRAFLTDDGAALLSEWNAKHGHPLADPGAPQARSIPDDPRGGQCDHLDERGEINPEGGCDRCEA
ncbi:MAG: hypothetical protein K0Q93_3317 [Nocardioidaceae bacterium]|nr:hypothetical protein [Nocardioidaceae bacterium]